ncbi:AEC family transporter [bacterium]|nr:AEC family transporter [bacterium]
MSILELGSLQLTLFAMMLIGALLKKKDIIDENGKKCLADLCINVVIPCNIFKSCLVELDAGVLKSCAMLFVSAVIMQLLCLVLNRFLFERYDPQRKKVLQCCTIVPMSGFLGNPIAEGIYNEVGVPYTSIFLIPMRIVMWSVGTTYFVAGETVEKKKLIKNVLTHPCLGAIYLGLLCMVTQVQLPSVILNSVKYIGNCNSALTMFIVGTILTDAPLKSIVSRDTVKFRLLRLALLPAAALGVGLLLHLEPTALGVSVLMTGMPAGATAVIFAAKYGSDAPFAARNVVFTTLLSMLTLPLWAYAVG